jgi:hypothetical protein
LNHVALKDVSRIRESIVAIFSLWRGYTEEEFQKHISWFRILEQLVLSRNAILMDCASQILSEIHTLPYKTGIWNQMLEILKENEKKEQQKQKIYHLPMINPAGIYETEWLNSILPKQIDWCPLTTLGELAASENPTLLIQNIPGTSMADMYVLFDVLAEANVKINVLHLSDEFSNDDLSFYAKASVKKVIRNYWRPELAAFGEKVLVIPLGFAKGRGASTEEKDVSFEVRPATWSFAGAADRPGRTAALSALRTVTPHSEHTKEAWSNPNVLEGPQYVESMRRTKFIPCFRGSRALESYRVYEAVEHGAIPIYVPSESSQSEDEYQELYGTHPFIGFPSWEKAAELLPSFAEQTQVMEKHRLATCAWWAAKKLDIKQKLAVVFT